MQTNTDHPPCITSHKFDLPTFQQAIAGFLHERACRNLSPSTLEFYSLHLLGFQRFLMVQNEALTPTAFPSFVSRMMKEMAEQGRAYETMKSRFHTCRRFFSFLYPGESWKAIELSVDMDIPCRDEKVFCFTDQQLEAVLRQPNQRTFTGFRDYVIMLVLLDTGIRLGELSALKVSDIDFHERLIRITAGKGLKSRFVPIQATCSDHLNMYSRLRGKPATDDLWLTCRGLPFCRASILRMIRNRCHGAGLTGVRGSAHTFRHTMAKNFLLNGGSVYALQLILGHTSLDMTRKYIRLFQGDLHAQHEKCSPVESLINYANGKDTKTWKLPVSAVAIR